MLEGHALGLEAKRQNGGEAVHAGGDGFQPYRAVVNGVEARHVGQQHLCGTDVGIRFLAADMLLAGLHRHTQRGLATGILGNADDATRHGALVGIAGGEEGGVGTTVTHRHAKALGGTQHHIGAQLARGFEQQQREQIGADASQSFLGLYGGNQSAQIFHLTCGGGVLEQGTKHLFAHRIARGADRHVETEVNRALLDHVDHLRVHVIGHEEEVGFGLGHPFGQRHRLGGGGRFIQQGGACQIHAGQIQRQLLEVEQGFETALCQLGLIGGVGGIPTRIFQHVAQNDMGHMGIVITHADVALGNLVLSGIALELGERLHFGHAGTDAERARQANGGRHGLGNQIVQAFGPNGRQQLAQLFLTRADMAADKISFLLEFKQ